MSYRREKARRERDGLLDYLNGSGGPRLLVEGQGEELGERQPLSIGVRLAAAVGSARVAFGAFEL